MPSAVETMTAAIERDDVVRIHFRGDMGIKYCSGLDYEICPPMIPQTVEFAAGQGWVHGDFDHDQSIESRTKFKYRQDAALCGLGQLLAA